MAGWYPPIEAHELDQMGELGRRIQATVERDAPPEKIAEMKGEIQELTRQLERADSEIAGLKADNWRAKEKLEGVADLIMEVINALKD